MSLLEKIGEVKVDFKSPNLNTFIGKGEENTNKDNDSLKGMKKSDAFIEKLRQSNFNLEEMEDAIKQPGNQLILSCAGSGKTTSLLCKLQYNILTGELSKKMELNGKLVPVLSKVLVTTFLNSGASELKDKMYELQDSMDLQKTAHLLNFSTLHSEFYKILKELGYPLKVISDKENNELLKKVLAMYKVSYGGKKLNSSHIEELNSALSYTRSRLDQKRYEKQIYFDCALSPIDIDVIINDWRKLRSIDGLLDFSDMEEILYHQACIEQNEKVLQLMSSKYDFIYLDEFQDMSQIQYKLVKVLAMNVKKIVAIGDDDQTIYSWRGSDHKIITEHFAKDFDATVSRLTYNFRCPSNILNMVIPSIEKNKMRLPKSLRAFNKGGVSKIKYFNCLEEASKYIFDITYMGLSRNLPVTVICRTNMDGLIPALTFEREGRFNFSISSRAMSLDNYIGRTILRVGKLFYSHDKSVINGALNTIFYGEKYSVSQLADFCSSNKITIFQTSDSDWEYNLPDYVLIFREWKRVLTDNGELSAFVEILNYLKYTVFAKDNAFNQNCREVIDSIILFTDTKKFKRVIDVIENLVALNNTLVSRIGQTDTRVKIVTAHEFKGKESDVVILWNDSEGVFPSPLITGIDELEEERRVHYIACTRASKEFYITSKKGKPGMFLKEMDLSFAEEA